VRQRKRKRQRLGESSVPAKRLRAERPNHVWALDFKFDTSDGRTLKLSTSSTRPALDAVRLAAHSAQHHRWPSASRPISSRGLGRRHWETALRL
jgi:hypothetical protein